MKKILIFFVLTVQYIFPQIVIAEQNFDGTNTLSYSAYGGRIYSGSSTETDNPALLPFYVSGSNSYGLSSGSAKLVFDNVSGLDLYYNKFLTFRLASWSIGSMSNGADAADSVTVQVSLNSGVIFSKELKIIGNMNARWHYSTGTAAAQSVYQGINSPVSYQPAGGGDRTTDGYSTVKLLLPDNASQVQLIIALKNTVQELWTIDNVQISGTPLIAPLLSVPEDSICGFCYVENGGPSDKKCFYVVGRNLLDSINLVPSVNYEISLDSSSGYTSDPIQLSANTGDSTAVYVRLKSNLSAGIYNEDLSVFSMGTDTINVFMLGEVESRIVVNEILADPGIHDVNGDGTADPITDRFIEFVNRDTDAADISGWKVYNSSALQHTFPPSTIIPGGEALVLFGGGSPAGFPGIVQTASSGSILINESGDTILIRRNDESLVLLSSYDSAANDEQSLARYPDVTGGFVKHTSITSNPVLYSPGRRNSDNSPLPVVLKSFSASCKENTVLLEWFTSNEINNYGFEVERSIPKRNWENVGFVKGSGFSNSDKYYSYLDSPLESGTYRYRLKQIDNDGNFKYIAETDVNLTVPTSFKVYQNYPNPFNSVTKINYSLPVSADVRVIIYSILGEVIFNYHIGNKEAGYHSYIFNAGNLPTGVYIYQVEVIGGGLARLSYRKMIVMK